MTKWLKRKTGPVKEGQHLDTEKYEDERFVTIVDREGRRITCIDKHRSCIVAPDGHLGAEGGE